MGRNVHWAARVRRSYRPFAKFHGRRLQVVDGRHKVGHDSGVGPA